MEFLIITILGVFCVITSLIVTFYIFIVYLKFESKLIKIIKTIKTRDYGRNIFEILHSFKRL